MQGLSPRNLKYMQQFATAYLDRAIVQAALAQITWYHHIMLRCHGFSNASFLIDSNLQSLFLVSGLETRNKVLDLYMTTHNGMRPQDIVLLLKIILWDSREWQYREIANELNMSISDVSHSLNRSAVAGLFQPDRRKVARQKLHEFIKYGLHVVFPILPGPIATGMLTAHSHPFYQNKFSAEDIYVWPDLNGSHRGQSIQPLYKGATIAAQKDENLYKLLASIDILRVGRPREINAALGVIENYLL
jgi:hypothetical protein